MSPLDDELRAALRGRASVLTPTPNPLAGIERRAGRMRRNRIAASVAGSMLAAALVAAVFPAIQVSLMSQPDVPPVASSTAPEPSPLASRPINAVDWPSTPLDPAQHDDYVAEWATTRERPGSPVEGEVLYSGRTPVGRQVFAFQLWFPGEPANLHVMVSDDAGPLPLGDTLAAPGLDLVQAIIPGEEFPYVLVLPRPGVDEVRYAADGMTFQPVRLQGRTALLERTGPTGEKPDRIQLLEGGRVVHTGEANPGGPTDGEQEGPDNLLGWPARGQSNEALQERAAAAYATAKDTDRSQVAYRVLLTADTDAGTRYTVLEAWVQGRQAQVFALIETPGRPPEPVLQPLTEPAEPVVAVLLTEQPGSTADELVVVPAPTTGQVRYAPNGSAEPEPVEPVPGLDGIVLLSRDRGAQDDRLRLIDGDGTQTFEGRVSDLLCGEKSCG